MQQSTADDRSSDKARLRVVIARGDSTTSFTVRPVVAGSVFGVCLLLVTAYLGAAAYLMLHDDNPSTTVAAQIHQARYYEDRIAELRARVDHVTSQSLVARQNYETQIAGLKKRQGEIDARHARVADVLTRAAQSGLSITAAKPLPLAKPGDLPAQEALLSTPSPAAPATPTITATPDAVRSDKLIMSRIKNGLEVIDRQSETALDLIALTAERRIARIERVTHSLSFYLDGPHEGVGEPYEPIVSTTFDDRLARADRAVRRLSELRGCKVPALRAAAERVALRHQPLRAPA
ncbi:hypothetical protein [Breoghania sp.]|uniref:hypothetical protein n=1 Tax=Breoghania sp. TaxID=2065378 RepID=UPI0026392DDB|nr:hypothetical protein [Breoghania sp.]MDJ0929573.1 hypothetical protein [Breoghania sp.]